MLFPHLVKDVSISLLDSANLEFISFIVIAMISLVIMVSNCPANIKSGKTPIALAKPILKYKVWIIKVTDMIAILNTMKKRGGEERREERR